MNRYEMLFTQLAEEACEVAQEAAKCNRFGAHEIFPEIGITNAERVMRECADLQALVEMLQYAGKLPMPAQRVFDEWKRAKKEKVEKLLHYSFKCGTLQDGRYE